MKEWALWYATEWNWPVFPLHWMVDTDTCSCSGGKDCKKRKGKHPITSNGFKAATTNAAQIEQWWTAYPDANIGLATGQDAGIIVVDADGDVGLASLSELGFPETVTAQSGSGVGAHSYFAYPLDAEPGTLRSWARGNDDLPGVDFRADGGYIVLPPSNHKSGNRYTWIVPPEYKKFKKAPTEFLDRYCYGRGSAPKAAAEDMQGTPDAITGNRELELRKRAGTLRKGGLDEHGILEALEYLNRTLVQPPLDDTQLETIAYQAAQAPSDVEQLNDGDGRNNEMTRRAGFFRRAGLDVDGIHAALRNLNVLMCVPPIDDAAVRHIAEQIGGKPTGDPNDYGGRREAEQRLLGQDGQINDLPSVLRTANMTDTGNAECFAELFRNKFKWVPQKKTWYVCSNEGIWQEDFDSRSARRAMTATVRARAAAAPGLPKKSDQNALFKHAMKSENKSGIESALSTVANLVGYSAQVVEFDADPWLLGVPNGVIELKTGTFRQAKPEDMISRVTGVPYDPTAACPLWEQFILDIMGGDEDLAAFIQRMCGYDLTGLTNEQIFVICYGLGANGKSTFLGVLRYIFGQYAATVAFDSFDADQRNHIGNDLAKLQGVRFVSCIESEHNRRLAEARIKSITGGDEITCRFLFGEYFSYLPAFTVNLAVNHLPTIRGGDHGIWRRVVLLPFNQNFSGRDDKNLAAKLKAEGPGILNWCLRGLGEWMRTGLNPPESIRAAVKEYRAETDQIGNWMEQYCHVDTDEDTRNRVMSVTNGYLMYKQWCQEFGERLVPMVFWQQRLRERGFERVKHDNQWFFRGLSLKDTPLDASQMEGGKAAKLANRASEKAREKLAKHGPATGFYDDKDL
jgi:putative DNA primase/helicase